MKSKTIIAHACALAVTSSYAYIPDSSHNFHRWYGALTASVLQPSNMDYFEELAGPPPSNEGVTNVNDEKNNIILIKAKYQPGFNALVGYFLTEQDDISLNYTFNYFNNKGSSNSNLPITEDEANSPFVKAEKTTHKRTYNSVDLSLGHFSDGLNWNAHFYGGLNYTHIFQDSTVKGSFPDLSSFDVENVPPFFEKTKIIFDGIGPQMGFEVFYKLVDYVHLVGGANAAVLASRLSGKFKDSRNDVISFIDDKRIGYNVALKTQANLGIIFQTMISDAYPFTIEVGYKGTLVQNQFNFNPNNRRSFIPDYAFSMHGPYLTVARSF